MPAAKPRALQVIAGTTRKDRDEKLAQNPIVDLPLVDVASPPPPNWLPNAHAVKEWRRLAPILAKVGLLTEGGLASLGVLCATHGKIVQVFAAGDCPPASMIATYRSLVNDFGLTPAAQGKVRAVGNPETPPQNEFGRNGKRPNSAGGSA